MDQHRSSFISRLLLALLALALLAGCKREPEYPVVKKLEFDEHASGKAYSFQWSRADEPYLRRLRAEYHLDDVVAGAKTDLEKVQAVTNWVRGLWKHDGSNMPDQADPIWILEAVERGERFRCVEYAIVINGCLNALGIPARQLNLRASDVETRESGAGHVVVEAYLRDEGRWVFADGQWGAVPLLDGRPLNAVEFQRALIAKDAGLEISGLQPADAENYRGWISQYLFYFQVPYDARVDDAPHKPDGLMLVSKGEKKPRVFQRTYRLDYLDYTNSLADFYPSPPVD